MSHGAYPVSFDLFERVSVSFATDIFEREDGSEKRINLTPLPTRTFEGIHLALTNAQKATLEAFFASMKGQLTEFSFVDPVNGVNYSVRFLDRALQFSRRPDTLWSLTVRLKEVL